MSFKVICYMSIMLAVLTYSGFKETSAAPTSSTTSTTTTTTKTPSTTSKKFLLLSTQIPVVKNVKTPGKQDPKCLHPREPGPCHMKLERFYYNAATNACEKFVFGGCYGNDNKFGFRKTCEDACLLGGSSSSASSLSSSSSSSVLSTTTVKAPTSQITNKISSTTTTTTMKTPNPTSKRSITATTTTVQPTNKSIIKK